MSNGMRVATPDIKLGDVVCTNGMRVLIDRPAHVVKRDGREVYAWIGTVTNPEHAITECGIPASFMSSHVWEAERGMWSEEMQYPKWNVQGNDLAYWWVERP